MDPAFGADIPNASLNHLSGIPINSHGQLLVRDIATKVQLQKPDSRSHINTATRVVTGIARGNTSSPSNSVWRRLIREALRHPVRKQSSPWPGIVMLLIAAIHTSFSFWKQQWRPITSSHPQVVSGHIRHVEAEWIKPSRCQSWRRRHWCHNVKTPVLT